MKVIRDLANTLLSNAPIIAIVLVVFNTFIVDFFYRQYFSLDIFPYLSTSEILSFSIFSLSSFSIFSFLLWSLYSVLPAIMLLNNSNIGGELDFQDNRVTAPLFVYAYPALIGISNIVIAVYSKLYPANFFVSQLWQFQVIPDATIYSAIATVLLTGILAAIYFRREKELRVKRSFKISTYLLILISIQFVSQVINGSKKECFEILKYGKYEGTIVELDSTRLISDKERTYIGRTGSAIFIYNFDTNTTTAVSVENVKSLTVKAKLTTERFIGVQVLK